MTAAVNREEIIDRLKKIRISPVAVHEAGHAVAACARRIKFGRVVLHPEPRREREGLVPAEIQGIVHPLLGRTQIKRRLFYLRLNDLIIVQLAGREAMELLFDKTRPAMRKTTSRLTPYWGWNRREFKSGGQAARYTVPSPANLRANAQTPRRLDRPGYPSRAARPIDIQRSARGRLPEPT